MSGPNINKLVDDMLGSEAVEITESSTVVKNTNPTQDHGGGSKRSSEKKEKASAPPKSTPPAKKKGK
jgi:hypothetical protein